MIGNERGKPAHAFARDLEIVRGPHRSGGHHLDFRSIAAGFARAFANETEAPFNQIRIGKLQDDAVADASGSAQGFGTVSGDPHRRYAPRRPRKTCADTIELDGFPRVEGTKRA